MNTFCTECGQPIREAAQFCAECGSAVAAPALAAASRGPVGDAFGGETQVADLGARPAAQAVPATVAAGASQPAQPGRRRRNSGRTKLWLAAATSAVLAVGATGAYLLWPKGPDVGNPGTTQGVVKLSDTPSLKWQRSLAQLVPQFGCPDNSANDGTETTSCGVNATVVGDIVVAAVSKATNDPNTSSTVSSYTYVAVDTEGNTKWTVSSPEGESYECTAGRSRLWCIARPQNAASSTDTSAAPASTASVVTFDLSNGQQVARFTVSGAGENASFAAVTPSATYLASTNDASSGAYTITRVGDSGKADWSRLVVFASQGSAYGRVSDEKLYFYSSDSAGNQVILNADSGQPDAATVGRIVSVSAGHVISQATDSGPLTVDKTLVPQDGVAYLRAFDRKPPLMLSTKISDTAATYQVVDDSNPSKSLFQVQGTPAFYCGGRLVTTSGSSYFGLDDKGVAQWTISSPEVYGGWCAGDRLVLRSGRVLTGYSLKDGQSNFTAALPQETGGQDGGPGGGSIYAADEITADGLVFVGDNSIYYVG